MNVRELRSAYDTIDAVRLHSLVSAEPRGGTPIVFVHGLGVSTRYMEPTMALLARDFDVAGPDFPGFGRSGSPAHILSVAELADVLSTWLDARGIGPAIFVGNSFGCQIIVECVARAPARALGIVLNAPTIDPAHRSMWTMLWRVLRDVPNEPLSLAVLVARDYLRAGPRRILSTLDRAIADRIEEKLPVLGMPVLVVCGAHDPVVTVRWGSEVARLVGIERTGAAGGTMECVDDAAHAMPYDDPETFAGIIARFAGEIGGTLGAD
ncbi:MAG: alpha/beta fold hydrolase [Gemmatimonadales bacterium]